MRPRRHLQRLAKIQMLGPVVGLAPYFHVVAVILPRANGRERSRLRRPNARMPFVEIHRRTRRMPREAGGGQNAIGRADIVAIREEQFVRFRKRHRGRNLALELELEHARVGFEIHQAAAALMLLARLGGPAKIDHRVGVAKQFHASLARHPDVLILHRVEKRPSLAKAVAFQHAAQHLQVARRVSGPAFDRRIVRVGAMVLDIVNVEAELSEPDQVMHQLPDHPRKRVPRRQMQHDDLALALALHRLRGDLSPRTSIIIGGRRGLRLSAPARPAA